MKVFVTGGTGFIGTHFIRLLGAAGHEALCLVRESSDVRELERAGAGTIRGDVRDRNSLLAGMEGCDWVANLANLYEFWVPDKRAYYDVNVTGTRNVMEAAIETGITKVVHVSTLAVYGDAAWPVTEASEVGPRCFTEYARSKRAGDLVVWDLYRQGNLPVVVIYPGAVIGSGDPKASGRYIRNLLLGKMPAQVLTASVFPFVHVLDVARALLGALETDGNIGEKYLLVAENLTFGEINGMLSEISGRKLPGMKMPDPLTMMMARLLTLLADLTGRPPALDMSTDQMLLMRKGLRADGSKAARELRFSYTPIRSGLEEMVQQIIPA